MDIRSSIGFAVDKGQTLLGKVRSRALLYTVVIAAATSLMIALTTIAWVPAVGVAAVALAATVNKLTQVLKQPVCLGCGCDLSKLPPTAYGIACPSCGTLNLIPPHEQPNADAIATAESAHPIPEIDDQEAGGWEEPTKA